MKTLNKAQAQELNEILNNVSNIVETSKDFIFNLKVEDLDFNNFFNDNIKDVDLIVAHILSFLDIDQLRAIKYYKGFYYEGQDKGAYKRKAMLLDKLNQREKEILKHYMIYYK